jgi:hypothetical protein
MFNILNAFTWLKNKKGDDAETMNILTVNDYYDRLKLIALSLFEWEGLPPTCNARFLEKTLFTYGRAIFVKDKALGYLNLKCTPSGELNFYDEPISYDAYGVSYTNKSFKKDECVLIRNNILERPTDNSVILFTSRLTEAERTIDVNIKAQKTPVIVRCDEKDRLTMINLLKKVEDNEIFIVGSKDLNVDGLKAIKVDAPFVADKVQIYKQDIWNEALTFFGINNANSDKRERLITDEVNANNEVISINAQAMLLTRLEACKQIKELYGIDVKVKMRSFDNVVEEKEETEGDDSGKIHS